MQFQIVELSEEHQEHNRNTHKHTHTHHTHAHIQSRKDSQFKKVHMSHKYRLALKDILIFC